MLFINKLFNSIACLLSFTNLQLVIPGRTWILLYLGRTVYKRLWACLALYKEDLDILMQPDSDDDRKNRKSSCVSKEDLDITSGTVQVKEYALKRRKKKVKVFHYASDGCDQMEQSRKAINFHEKENHPDLTYNCTECGVTNFSSYEAMFKHSQ